MLVTWIISFMSPCLRLLAAGMFYIISLSHVNDCESHNVFTILQGSNSSIWAGDRISVACFLKWKLIDCCFILGCAVCYECFMICVRLGLRFSQM
jgi:hypothetical protein